MPSPGHINSGIWQPELDDRDNGRPGPRSALVGDGSAYHQPLSSFRWEPELVLNNEHAHNHYVPIREGAPSYIDAESCVSVYPEEPALANPRLGDQRERRRLYEPAWVDMSRRPQYGNVANEPTRLSHAVPIETRGEPPVPVSVPHRESQYITPTCPCGIPNCRANAIRKQYFDHQPERRDQAVRATLDFGFDRIGFTVMDGTSATWIGQPGDDTPPPLSDKPMPRRTAESKKHLPTPTQPEPHATSKVTSAGPGPSERAKSRMHAALSRIRSDELSRRISAAADADAKTANRSKKAGSKKSSSSSKASVSSTKSSSSFNGSYSSKRSHTLVAGAETDIDEGSTLGINLLMKD
ncbi:hypothetical protein IWX90DRAFT_484429 [Phyllosticta citrichinensis]|uniref:Post-SET domain-containing protein n=1 Tax=Phyllosticta citrichinensis TaxID=1130410 RepID=A0ABR1XZD6_9PEZI